MDDPRILEPVYCDMIGRVYINALICAFCTNWNLQAINAPRKKTFVKTKFRVNLG